MGQNRPYSFALNTTNILRPDWQLPLLPVSFEGTDGRHFPTSSAISGCGLRAAVRRRNRMAESVPGTLGATYAADLSKVERTFD